MSFLATMAAALPAVADVAGNIAGAFLGHHENKANRRESAYQFEQQMDNSIQRRVEDGLKAGINPLAAIGASANVSPTFGGPVSDTAGFASGAIKGLGGLFKDKMQDDLEYDSEVKSLDLESRRLQNRILRNEANSSFKNLSGGAGQEVIPPVVSESKPNRIGDKPLFQPVYDLQGRPRLVVNQDVVEGDSDNAGYIASLKHGISQGFIDKISGEVKSDQYRMMLDDMYYNMTGHHIANLDKLYISPAEVAIAAAELYGQVRGK